MHKSPKISVLMSVFDTEFSLVKRAIDSVLSQTFQEFELIVIDDGSQNDPNNLLLTYVKQHEDRVTYLRHKNCGQSESINKGIKNCTGDYVTIIDADDEYKIDHLGLCLNKMLEYDLIASNTTTVVDKEQDYYVPDKHDITKMIHVDECILFATLFGRKEVFDNLKFQKKYAADALFFEHASLKYKAQKVDLRSYIYYRNNPNSLCAKMKNNLTNPL
jgi:glycosyltransferase involved in cell wall biosynthesis